MNSTLFIHIGFHKTGSTALQNFLVLNRVEFQKQGVLYPGNTENHFSITKELREITNPFLNKKTQVYQIFKEILNKSNNYSKFILSSEGFCNNEEIIIPALIKALTNFKIKAKVKIIIYLRPQESWLESSYQQTIKDRSTRSVNTFKQHHTSENYLNYCNYYARINIWASNFGKENIIIIPYNLNQPKNIIYDNFIETVGITMNSSFIYPSKLKTNVALHHHYIEFLRLLNIIKIEDKIFAKIIELFYANQNKEYNDYKYFNTEEEKKIELYFYQSNAKLAQEYISKNNSQLFEKQLSNNIKEKQVFNPENCFNDDFINNQLKAIFEKNENLIEDLFIEILISELNNNEALKAKSQLTSIIKKILGDNLIQRIIKKYPNYNSNNILYLDKTIGWNTDLLLNYYNFKTCTFDFSNHCNYKIKQKLIYLKSTGNDPYFSIQRVFGNFDSQTSIKIIIDSSADTVLQIYFQERNYPNYSENKSLKTKIRKGLNTVFFMIDNPDFNGQIRIDPGNISGKFFIHEIVIKSNAKTYEELFIENKKISELLSNKYTEIQTIKND